MPQRQRPLKNKKKQSSKLNNKHKKNMMTPSTKKTSNKNALHSKNLNSVSDLRFNGTDLVSVKSDSTNLEHVDSKRSDYVYLDIIGSKTSFFLPDVSEVDGIVDLSNTSFDVFKTFFNFSNISYILDKKLLDSKNSIFSLENLANNTVPLDSDGGEHVEDPYDNGDDDDDDDGSEREYNPYEEEEEEEEEFELEEASMSLSSLINSSVISGLYTYFSLQDLDYYTAHIKKRNLDNFVPCRFLRYKKNLFHERPILNFDKFNLNKMEYYQGYLNLNHMLSITFVQKDCYMVLPKIFPFYSYVVLDASSFYKMV